METFHFGSSKQKLFGIYTPPSGPAVSDAAVLLCYPFGQEYMRAHMAYRQLATLLSRSGLPVMRFDYYATGDSYGDSDDAVFSTWMDNTNVAIDELIAMSGVSRIYLAGLRLGALVAATIAETRSEVKKLVLWDPVVSGNDYLVEVSRKTGEQTKRDSLWINGYAMSNEFRSSIAAADIRAANFAEDTEILQIISHENSAFRSLATKFGTRFEQQLVPSPGDWNYVDSVGSILLPHLLVRAIKDWLVK